MPEEETSPAAPSRRAKRRHFIEYRPEETPPLWRRIWFRLFALAAVLVLLPTVPAAWHIVGPDDKAPPPVVLPPSHVDWGDESREGLALPTSPDAARTRVVAASLTGRVLAGIPSEVASADVRSGARYDAQATPAFVAEANRRLAAALDADSIAEASAAPATPADIVAADGLLRAAIASGRAHRDARGIAADYLNRLELARSLVFAVSTPHDFLHALRHERDVLAEIRFDAEWLAADPGALKILLPALAAHAAAPDVALTKALALRFDARLDVLPDPGLRVMYDRSLAPADASRFERIARFARKPSAHRKAVSDMLDNFGAILAKPTYVESGRGLLKPASEAEVTLAATFLRARVFDLLGGDVPTRYFYPEPPAIEPLLEFFLKFDAFTESRDVFGVALLSYRRAELLNLLANLDRTRFDAGATAYHLGLRYRRALAGGKWPKDSEGLFDGLLDSYPLDPFTDEPVAYSRKNLTLHSPGADGVDRNGIEDAEFASELAELWEPTIPLETGREPDPAAFGIRIEKPGR